MLRIGLVGSASASADTYARLLNIDRALGDRARITAIWSAADPERTESVARNHAIPTVAGSLHQVVDAVDAAIIVDRHGDLHAEHALPFLLEERPVFVDRPLAIDLADCRRMLATASRTGTPITSATAAGLAPDTRALRDTLPAGTRLVQVAGASDLASPHGGLFFTATELIEVAIAILGDRIAGVQVTRAANTLVVDAVWSDDTVVTLGYVAVAPPHPRATLVGADRVVSREIRVDDAAHTALLEMAVRMMETGAPPRTDRQLLLPIVVVTAITRSLDTGGGWVDIPPLLDEQLAALR